MSNELPRKNRTAEERQASRQAAINYLVDSGALDTAREFAERPMEDGTEFQGNVPEPSDAREPSAPSAAERTLRARIASLQSWANTTDRSARTAAARRGLEDKFWREADPENVLSPPERAKRAEVLRKLHYSKMALKSAQARRRRK